MTNETIAHLSDPDAVLAIRGLRKRFVLHAVDGRVIDGLRGVDLDVARGEHVALAGSSGAGKSSLLKCIHRTYLADGGTIEFRTAGGDVVDLARLDDRAVATLRERQLGYVSQFLRAEPRRGALDVVARAARRSGLDGTEAREAAADMLQRVSIGEELWQTYPTMLSGGEKQRVNLAAGIVAPPLLLLLDEPVSALDPANRQSVLDVISSLADTGTTIVSVFHDLDAMAQIADRIVLLGRGQVLDEGEPTAMLAQLAGSAR